MPDDLIKDESAEQSGELPEEVDDALASFMEDDDDHTEGQVGDGKDDVIDEDEVDDNPDEKPPVKDDLKKATGKKAEKELKKETGEIDDKDKIEYPEGLKERLDQTANGGLVEKPVKPPEPPPEPEPKKVEPEKKADTPAPLNFGNILEDLPDQEITIGDHKINLKDYKKDYPEDFAAIMAVGSIMAQNMIQDSLKTGQFIKADAVAPLQDKILDMEFWDQISLVHSDAKKINKSTDFLDWLDGQDEPLQRLARNMEKPEDGVLIIDFYKKSKGKKKVAEHDQKLRDKKKQTDDLHKGTMRNKQTVQQSDDVDMDDAKAAFEEDDLDEDEIY